MKKYAIIVDEKYLREFVTNESYCVSGRVIGNTGLHNESEYTPIFQEEPKLYDSRTCKDYLSCLVECIRWNGINTNNIKVEVVEC